MTTADIKSYFENVIAGCKGCFLVERRGGNTFYIEWEHGAIGLIKKHYIVKDLGMGYHIETIT